MLKNNSDPPGTLIASSSTDTNVQLGQPSFSSMEASCSSMVTIHESNDTALWPMDLADFIDAIFANNREAILNWYQVRLLVCDDNELSGLHLARTLGHHEIADIIEANLQISRIKRLANQTNFGSVLHSRTKLSFDNNHYFTKVMLETFTNGKINLYVCYSTPLEYLFLR